MLPFKAGELRSGSFEHKKKSVPDLNVLFALLKETERTVRSDSLTLKMNNCENERNWVRTTVKLLYHLILW